MKRKLRPSPVHTLCVLALVVSCDRHDHDHSAAAHEADGPEPVGITRWTDAAELYVEFPPPEPGKPTKYHAHVTLLDGFQAVKAGRFAVAYVAAGKAVAEARIDGVARPGIFTPEGVAPPAGDYALEMRFEADGKTEAFDCGTVRVGAAPEGTREGPAAAIQLLKETQWTIPFGTAWADERLLATEIELSGTVEPAASDQLTVGAPTGGRFFHNPKLALAEGLRVKKGDVIGHIAPTVAGDDFSRLQLAVEEARLRQKRLTREIERIDPMVKDGALPARRLIELESDLAEENARLRAAGSRLGRVTASGGRGGLAIKSTLDGLVSQVLVPNGESVDAGVPLVRIGGTDHLWIRARFVARPTSVLADATPTRVRLADGTEMDLSGLGARFLSSHPVVDPTSRIATWIVDIAPKRDAAASAKPSTAELRAGASVVLAVAVGKPVNALSVPRSAIIEINTRPYVFVQIDGEHFEKRGVSLGRTDGPLVEVVSGVRKGERVVTKGGFDVHLASLMGTVESHRH